MTTAYIDIDDAHTIKEGASVTFHCYHCDTSDHESEYIYRNGTIVIKDGVHCFLDEYGDITPTKKLISHLKSILIEYAEFITDESNLITKL